MSQLKKPTIKNPDLVAAMAEFKKQQSVQTEKEMLDAIAAASFIAPITWQYKLYEVEPDENGQLLMEASLMAGSNKDGVKFFPAFTDWLEFLKWKNDPDADTMVITFDQYCGILLKQGVDVSGIVINPAETNIVIRKEKMAEMKGVSLEAEQPQEAPKKNNILPLFGCEKVTNPEVIGTSWVLDIVTQGYVQEQLEPVKAAIVARLPAGFVAAWPGNTPPDGWLVCNGSAVSRTTYADLFAAIGTTFGAGDGSTTFKLPDYQGDFLRGYLSGTSSAIGTRQAEGLPNISGYISYLLMGEDGQKSDGALSATLQVGNRLTNAGTGSAWKQLNFSAKNSNAIYGANSHVTPRYNSV